MTCVSETAPGKSPTATSTARRSDQILARASHLPDVHRGNVLWPLHHGRPPSAPSPLDVADHDGPTGHLTTSPTTIVYEQFGNTDQRNQRRRRHPCSLHRSRMEQRRSPKPATQPSPPGTTGNRTGLGKDPIGFAARGCAKICIVCGRTSFDRIDPRACQNNRFNGEQ